MSSGSIPVLAAMGETLADMWENSLLALHQGGCSIRTQYDRRDADEEYIDPPSLDCTMMMTCPTPAREPSIHRSFPGGLEDLEEYRMEVVLGIKDHWVEAEADGTRWSYTYHDRLCRYPSGPAPQASAVDQLAMMVEALAASPESRRVQAITWKVWEDPGLADPPCLQSIWARILPDEDDVWHLNMNVRFRSRDAYKAAFMNVWALAGPQGLQGNLARRVSERAGREVRCGHYCDLSDSYHIYGKDLRQFDAEVLGGMNRSLEERRWHSGFAVPFFQEARGKILEKIESHDRRSE